MSLISDQSKMFCFEKQMKKISTHLFLACSWQLQTHLAPPFADLYPGSSTTVALSGVSPQSTSVALLIHRLRFMAGLALEQYTPNRQGGTWEFR